MSDDNLRVTVRGLLIATGIVAIFVTACMIPSQGQGNRVTISLFAVKTLSFCAALAAPFERALAGMCVGLGFFLMWLALLVIVSFAAG